MDNVVNIPASHLNTCQFCYDRVAYCEKIELRPFDHGFIYIACEACRDEFNGRYRRLA